MKSGNDYRTVMLTLLPRLCFFSYFLSTTKGMGPGDEAVLLLIKPLRKNYTKIDIKRHDCDWPTSTLVNCCTINYIKPFVNTNNTLEEIYPGLKSVIQESSNLPCSKRREN